MFLHLLFIVAISDPSKFDRFERRHQDNNKCYNGLPDNSRKLTLDVGHNQASYYRDCQSFDTVEISADVNTLSSYIFYGSSVTTVNFLGTSTLTSIGIGAFAYSKLTTIALPPSLKSINEGAFFNSSLASPSFNNCKDLVSIGKSGYERTLLNGAINFDNKDKLTTIDERAFYGTSISSISSFPTDVTIKGYAFAQCSSLTTLPANINVKEIDSFAFDGCTGLTGTVAIKTTYIGEHAFHKTGSLQISQIQQRTDKDNNRFGISIEEYALSGKIITGNIDFSSVSGLNVIEIRQFAFFHCTFQSESINLEKATIDEYSFANTTYNRPGGCTLSLNNAATVPKHAFEFTSGTPLQLQTKVDHRLSIGEFSFYYSHVSTPSDSPLYLTKVSKKSFAHCLNLKKIVNITGESDVGAYAFANCTSLEGPLILNCQDIGESAFEFCTSLASFNMTENHPEGTSANPSRTIGTRAFYASGLNSNLLLHSFISSIGEYAFARCRNLKIITIYSNKIKEYAFAECGTLNGPITIYSKDIQFHAFDKTNIGTLTIDTKYDYDSDTYNVHNQAFYGTHFLGPVYIRDHVTVNNYAFYHATFHNLLLIDADSVGQYSFAECNTTQACNVSIGETQINNHAFEFFGINLNRSSLEFHALEGPTKSIGNYAFYNSGFNNELVIPRYFTDIGSYAFYNCPIKSVNINFGDSTIEAAIGSRSFEGSGISLLSITSNGAKVSIKDHAFYGTAINHELIMPVDLKDVGQSAFENCDFLTGVVFSHNSNSLSLIDKKAFCGCPLLRGEIYIPSTVIKVGESAFENCTQLNRLTLVLEGSLKIIDDNAFAGCKNIANSIDIPYNVVKIGNKAFYNCENIGDHLSVKTTIENPTYSSDYDLTKQCTIGDHAFEGCTSLKTLDFIPTHDGQLTLYQKLRSIGDYAFYNSGIMGQLYLPSLLVSIGDFAFTECAISGEISIPSSLKSIGESTFENCNKIIGLSFQSLLSTSSSLSIKKRAFYLSSVGGSIDFPRRITLIGESAFEKCSLITSISFASGSSINKLTIEQSAFKNTGIIGILSLPSWLKDISEINNEYGVGEYAFANCYDIREVQVRSGGFRSYVFENCTSIDTLVVSGGELGPFNFNGCNNNITIYMFESGAIGDYTFANYQEGWLYLDIYGQNDEYNFNSPDDCRFGYRAFYNSNLTGSLLFTNGKMSIDEEAFAQCKYLLGHLYIKVDEIKNRAFADSVFNGSLVIDYSSFEEDERPVFGQNILVGSSGFVNLSLIGITGTITNEDGSIETKSITQISDYAFSGMSFPNGILEIDEDVISIGKYAFQGCGFYRVDFKHSKDEEYTVEEGAFADCNSINTTVDLSHCTTLKEKVPARLFKGCSQLPGIVFPSGIPSQETKLYTIQREAFCGCSSFYVHSDFFLDITRIEKNAFSGCRSLNGPLYIETTLQFIDEYAFSDCTGFSDRLTIHVNPRKKMYIGPSAFSGCEGFKKGKLYIFIDSNEELDYDNDKYQLVDNGFRPYYKYKYFLTIGNEAFKDTKFNTVYYNGRFQPECDYDIGFSHTKGIHTSSNYVNKSFCNYPLHSNKLSGGAIAGITIAVIVVVAALVVLLLFFLCKMKKSKDKSEDEVEMNADP